MSEPRPAPGKYVPSAPSFAAPAVGAAAGSSPVPVPPPPGYPSAAYPTASAPRPAPGPQFSAPFVAPQPGRLPVVDEQRRTGAVGIVALVVALLAMATSVPAGVAAYAIGAGSSAPSSASADLSFLTPVRDSVLLAEISFWTGTVLGIWALVQGIVAIAARRGRGAGIAAVIVAVMAVVVFTVVGFFAAVAGAAGNPAWS